MRNRQGDNLAMAMLLAVVLAVLFLAAKASGHQAPSGFEYDSGCCSNADCAPVPDTTIEEVQGGYSAVIPPGAHPMVSPRVGAGPAKRFFPHGDQRIRPSGDERKHACVGPTGVVYCIYVPPGGV